MELSLGQLQITFLLSSRDLHLTELCPFDELSVGYVVLLAKH
jgi:hypothetical protein